jgi:hypothetical protein
MIVTIESVDLDITNRIGVWNFRHQVKGPPINTHRFLRWHVAIFAAIVARGLGVT